MIETVRHFFTLFNETFTFYLVFPAIVLLGLYLTVRLRFVQVSKLKMSFSFLVKKQKGQEGNISHYEAVSAVVAGNLGTGNISGMAVALTTGGPGALVWMWVMAFLGAAIQYASCVLGVKFRQKNEKGEYVGGPMYYLSQGLGYKGLGAMFCVLTMFAALTVGNFAQVHSVTMPLEKLGMSPFWCGIAIAVLVGIVVLGGIQRLAKVAAKVVPLMALLYLGAAFVILAAHLDQVLPGLWLMIKSAFNATSAVGGVMGYGVVKIISAGFDRGLFATDAGTGIVPILQSSARTENPIMDGIVTLITPLLVMIVCTTTGLVLIVTGAWQQPGLFSTNMVTYAFQEGLGSQAGMVIVLVALALFAYTTIVAWAYCGEKAMSYLCGDRYIRFFQYLYLFMIPIGTLVHVDLVWALADISISLMLMTNIIGVAGLSGEVIGRSREYFYPALRKQET